MDEDDLVECEACGKHVDALYPVYDMYSVCKDCADNHGLSDENDS